MAIQKTYTKNSKRIKYKSTKLLNDKIEVIQLILLRSNVSETGIILIDLKNSLKEIQQNHFLLVYKI